MSMNMILHAAKLIKDQSNLQTAGLGLCVDAGALVSAIAANTSAGYVPANPNYGQGCEIGDGVLNDVVNLVCSAVNVIYINSPDITIDELDDEISSVVRRWLMDNNVPIRAGDPFFSLDYSDFEALSEEFLELDNYELTYGEDDLGNRCYLITCADKEDLILYSLADVWVAYSTIKTFA